jgi:hypothetical protein
MFKSTNTTYLMNCAENETKISTQLDLGSGVPFLDILDLGEGQNKINLRFLDMQSLDQMILCLQIIKDELNRFDMSDHAVS